MPMNDEEKESWFGAANAFLKEDRPEGPGAKRRRVVREMKTLPKLASLDWLTSVEHLMRGACDRNFEGFANKQYLASPVDADGVVQFPPGAVRPGCSIPSILVFTTDQHSVQTCSIWYLQSHLELSATHMADPFHASWNSTKEACAAAELQGSLQACVTVCNVAYGPFQSSAFHSKLRTAAMDIATSFSVNDPILNFLWGGIVADKRITDLDSQGPEGRQQFLANLLVSPCASIKGPKASSSRWYSIIQAFDHWGSEWNSRLLLMIYLSVKSGWARGLKDILIVDKTEQHEAVALAIQDVPDEQPRPVDGALRPDQSGNAAAGSAVGGEAVAQQAPARQAGASSSSSSAQAAAPPGIAQASQRQRGRSLVTAARSKAEHTVHAVARLMANADLRRELRLISLASRPFGAAYSELAHSMRGYEKNCEFYTQAAHWGFMADLKKCVMSCNELGDLERAGFVVDMCSYESKGEQSRAAMLEQQDNLMAGYWRLIFCLVRSHGNMMMKYILGVPYLFAGLLHPDNDKVSQHFGRLRELYEASEEAQRRGSPLLVDIVTKSPLQTPVALWGFKFASAGKWQRVTAQMREFLGVLFESCGQTKLIEDSVQHLRDHETRDGPSKSLGRFLAWEQLVNGAILGKHSRVEVKSSFTATPGPGFTPELGHEVVGGSWARGRGSPTTPRRSATHTAGSPSSGTSSRTSSGTPPGPDGKCACSPRGSSCRTRIRAIPSWSSRSSTSQRWSGLAPGLQGTCTPWTWTSRSCLGGWPSAWTTSSSCRRRR